MFVNVYDFLRLYVIVCECVAVRPNFTSQLGVPTWRPNLASRIGVPTWRPILASRIGVPTWRPKLGVLQRVPNELFIKVRGFGGVGLRVPTSRPNLASQLGVPTWRPNFASQLGVPTLCMCMNVCDSRAFCDGVFCFVSVCD